MFVLRKRKQKVALRKWKNDQLTKQRQRCYYCNCLMDTNTYNTDIGERIPINACTIDHKIPRSKGGTSERWNLVLACHGCNNQKADQLF